MAFCNSSLYQDTHFFKLTNGYINEQSIGLQKLTLLFLNKVENSFVLGRKARY